jgi:hypothetical protein
MTRNQETLLEEANKAFHDQHDALKVVMDAKNALMAAIAESIKADHRYMMAMNSFHRAMTEN